MGQTTITAGETTKLTSRDLFGEKHDTFYRAIGTCIGSWAWVDEKFFEIFQACVGAPVTQCAIIYYKVPGLDARITLTDEIVCSRLPQAANGEHTHSSVAQWLGIRKRATDLLSTRRRVAHHPVHISIWGKEDEGGKILDVDLDQTAFEIYVSEHERARKPDKTWKALTLADLEKHANAVVQVSRDLGRFLEQVLPEHLKRPSPR